VKKRKRKLANIVELSKRALEFAVLEAAMKRGLPLEDFEYLIHHIEKFGGKEEIHHCYLYDHIGNLYEQGHLEIKGGKAYLDGKLVKDGLFHIIKGFEKSQEVAYTNAEAVKAKIKPKAMKAGMTLKQKAKEW